MKNLIILLIVVFSVSCAHLKSAEQNIYVKSVKISTNHGITHVYENAKIYRNPGRTEVHTIDSTTIFITTDISKMTLDSVWSE